MGFVWMLAGLAGGCAGHPAVIQVVDYHAPSDVKRYQETFDEAYYDVDDQGDVHIVLRRQAGAWGSGEDFTQVVRIKSVWRHVPGRSVSHRSAVNAQVSYFLVGARTGESFEGAGSVHLKVNKKGTKLTATLDQALVRPARKIGSDESVFTKAELSGKIEARRDRRQVVRLSNDMERTFGPQTANR